MMWNTTASKLVVVFGVNGQDGSYAAEHFQRAGLHVVGVGRQPTAKWVKPSTNLTYKQCDLRNLPEVRNLIQRLRPDIIFNAAAVHGSAGYDYEANWEASHIVNTQLTHLVLEYCRTEKNSCRYLFLSSSKVFQLETLDEISCNSPRTNSCIYTITKNSSDALIRYYRETHGIISSIVYTFNHESVRRGTEYFIPKIMSVLVDCVRTGKSDTELYSLDFWCDWGHAREFMRCAVQLSLETPGIDICLATGRFTYARSLVDQIFSSFGLDYSESVRTSVHNPEIVYFPPQWRVNTELPDVIRQYEPRLTVVDICNEILQGNYGLKTS